MVEVILVVKTAYQNNRIEPIWNRFTKHSSTPENLRCSLRREHILVRIDDLFLFIYNIFPRAQRNRSKFLLKIRRPPWRSIGWGLLWWCNIISLILHALKCLEYKTISPSSFYFYPHIRCNRTYILLSQQKPLKKPFKVSPISSSWMA